MNKKIIALLLSVVLLLGIFAACAPKDETKAPRSDSQTNNAGPDNAGADTDTNQNADSDEPVDTDDLVTVRFVLLDFSNKLDTAAGMMEAFNTYTEKNLGIHVEMEIYGYGDFTTQVNLKYTGGENFDLLSSCTAFLPFNTMFANNQMLPLDDLIQEYAPLTYEAMKPYLSALTMNGNLYGVPNYRLYCSDNYVFFRKDVLEELDMVDRARNLTSWSELEALYADVEAAYANEDNFYMVAGGMGNVYLTNYRYTRDSFDSSYFVDTLNDNTGSVMAMDNRILHSREDENLLTQLNRLVEWKEKGWIYPDAEVTQETSQTQMQNGIVFSLFANCEFGAEAAKSAACGTELIATKIGGGLVTGSQISNFSMFIPTTAEEPEAAMRLIEALHNDPELANIRIWGVEGTDYVVENGVANFPEGKELATVNYHSADYMAANQFILTPWGANPADFYQKADEVNRGSEISQYLGFSMDTTPFTNYVANISAVTDEYEDRLQTGSYTEELYAEYLSKLEVAGVYDYLEGVQEQLDAWLAQN